MIIDINQTQGRIQDLPEGAPTPIGWRADLLRSIHTSVNVCVCVCVCIKLQHVYEDVASNVKDAFDATSSLTQCYHLDTNAKAHANVDASVNGPLVGHFKNEQNRIERRRASKNFTM